MGPPPFVDEEWALPRPWYLSSQLVVLTRRVRIYDTPGPFRTSFTFLIIPLALLIRRSHFIWLFLWSIGHWSQPCSPKASKVLLERIYSCASCTTRSCPGKEGRNSKPVPWKDSPSIYSDLTRPSGISGVILSGIKFKTWWYNEFATCANSTNVVWCIWAAASDDRKTRYVSPSEPLRCTGRYVPSFNIIAMLISNHEMPTGIPSGPKSS